MDLKQISPNIWELPKDTKRGMRVPGKIVSTPELLPMIEDEVFNQLVNTACLPGIVDAVWLMPDTHVGYGVPVGAVFATDPEKEGVISPGAVGFDINCGVRLITTNLSEKDILIKIDRLIDALFDTAGAGLGGRSKVYLNRKEVEEICLKGAQWPVSHGFGLAEDVAACEENGALVGADPKAVSEYAFRRSLQQLGSLGSGNHYLEVQKVVEILDDEEARHLGILKKGQITIMLHSGSRGFGHQIATDYLYSFGKAMAKYKINVPDRQLACAPINSSEGRAYFAAMACAVNYAFANRQVLTHQIRKVFAEVFSLKPEEIRLVYDVAHNVAKFEEYPLLAPENWGNGRRGTPKKRPRVGVLGGKRPAGPLELSDSSKHKKLLVHRKGATRALDRQPVIIGGSMETNSYLLLGTKKAEELTFSSTCHGAGRTMSRTAARRQVNGQKLKQDLYNRGIHIKTASFAGLAEEAGLAYKDVDLVIKAVSEAGISLPIAKFAPIGNIKG